MRRRLVLLDPLAGLLLAFNFVAAVLMVHWGQTYQEQWPALALIAFVLVVSTIGAGRWSLDTIMEHKSA